jgi:uncharacterized surface protein with fasciclin (FAS1) repeats
MKKALFGLALVSLGLFTVLTVPRAETALDRPQVGLSSRIVGGAGGAMGWKAASIWDVISSHREFSDFQKAVSKAGLSNLLDTKGPFTVFVPTDSGFERLPAETEEQILTDSNVSRGVVLNHTAEGRLLYNVTSPIVGTGDLARMGYIMTSVGTKIPIEVTPSAVKVGQARLLIANIQASNGVIHVVDDVNLPPAIQPSSEGQGE